VRKTYRYDDLEIVIDDVKELGVFVEVEAQGQYANVYDATVRIHSFLRDL